MTNHSNLTRALYTQLHNLIEASKSVVENWERGDLAGAVNTLEATALTAEQVLEAAARQGVKP